MLPIFNSACEVLILGLIRIVTTPPYSPKKRKMVGFTGSKGDVITISFTTPTILKACPPQCMVCPTGCFRFMNFAADSLRIIADESDTYALEKSRPSTNFHLTVLPYSPLIEIIPKSSCVSGLLPGHDKPL